MPKSLSQKSCNTKKDIKIRTQKFAVYVIKLCEEFKKKNVDFVLVKQLLRSGTSVGANVREGKASSTKKELIRYYEIALRSANETDYWMDIIKEGYQQINFEILETHKKELSEICKVLATIIINLKK